MSFENIGMLIAWAIFIGALLFPFLLAFFAALNGKPTVRQYPVSSSNSDNEHKQVALMKDQVDLLDKNRRESWTSPTYFKK